ncbi:MAG: hypothetical protein U0R78_05330 [Nocardioidaceae bacterium]
MPPAFIITGSRIIPAIWPGLASSTALSKTVEQDDVDERDHRRGDGRALGSTGR